MLAGWIGAIVGQGIRIVSNVLIASMAGIDVWIYRIAWDSLVLSVAGTGLAWLVFSAVRPLAIRIGR
jgi:hypothetical protein